MEVDNIGNKDYMAILVTKSPIDYKTLNASVNKQSGSYEQKLRSALGNKFLTLRINHVNFILQFLKEQNQVNFFYFIIIMNGF